jgi:hypothetical protein
MPFSEEFMYRDCPWCHVRGIAMRPLADTVHVNNSKHAEREWTWLICPRCAGVVSIETDPRSVNEIKSVPAEDSVDFIVKHLPVEVERPYINAITVLNAGVPSSAAVELRPNP